MNYLRHSLDKLCLSSHNLVLAFCKKLVVYDFSSAIIHCSQWQYLVSIRHLFVESYNDLLFVIYLLGIK